MTEVGAGEGGGHRRGIINYHQAVASIIMVIEWSVDSQFVIRDRLESGCIGI